MLVVKERPTVTDRLADIIDRVVDHGESVRSVGALYGISGQRVDQILKEAGISVRAVRREKRENAKRACGICGQMYVIGTYAAHCKATGHRHLRPAAEKPERNMLVVDLYVKEKHNTSEIAEYFALPQPVITRILHRNSVYPNGRRRRKGGLIKGAGTLLFT